jgi:PAS domain S-box-containing protein
MDVPNSEAELAKAYLDLQVRYRNVVSRSLAGVYRTSLDGRILECNDALAHMLGYTNSEELLRKQAKELYGSIEEREHFLADLQREGKLINYELRLQHRNGREVYVLENVHLDEFPGQPTTIQGTLIDITAFRQAELEQRSLMNSYRNLVEHIRDGLIVLRGGRVVYANPAADQVMGRSFLGTALAELLHEEDPSVIERLHQVEVEGQELGPMPVKVAGREFILYAVGTTYEGGAALQLTLQDHSAQQGLLRERMRVRMADEVNQVLRAEIEEHRRTQEALRHSRRFARSLIDSSLDMIMAADPEGLITEYNPAASLRFGWEPEEVMGRRSDMLYADPEEYRRVQKELDTHGMFSGEIQNVTREGEVFTSFIAASKMYDEDGRLLGAMGVSRDITSVKRDQESLRASEERYRDLLENATDLVQSVGVDGHFLYVNAAWRNTLGYTPEEVSQLTLMDVIHPEHKDCFADYFAQVLQGQDAGSVRTVFKTRDGRDVTVEGNTNLRRVDGRPVSTRSILRDITNVQLAQRQVQEHEAKLRALFESSDHMFWTVDRAIKLTSYNRGYANMIERLYGVEPEINTDPGKPRKRFADPEYHAFWEAKYAEAFAGRPVRFETQRTDREGQTVWNENFLSPVFGPDGKVQEVFGVGHEITEQKAAEGTVRDQAARLRAIFDSSANMMIWTLDKDLRITACNAHFQKTVMADFGVEMKIGDRFIAETAEQAAGKNNTRYTEIYRAALKGKPQQFEAELVDKHGKTIWVENFLNPILLDGEVQELSCLAYTITDRKESQMELLRSLHEKEVLLKEVHHRVKNNLQIVSSIFSLQTAHVGEDKRIQDLLRDSRDRIRSMSFIHESLYQNKDFSSIDLADYMEGLSRNLMMSYSLTGKVALETDLERVDLVLDQAIPCGLILNELISNALKHAFPDGRAGTVTIGLKQEGNKVCISLSDNGAGLAPGFDAKRDANLGLELVHTLVEQLDGELNMSNDEGVSYLLTFERLK